MQTMQQQGANNPNKSENELIEIAAIFLSKFSPGLLSVHPSYSVNFVQIVASQLHDCFHGRTNYIADIH